MSKLPFWALMLVAVLIVPPARADTITGTVIGVSDGDTLTILDQRKQLHKVRLAGIDAPEKTQDFGQRAKLNLSAMVYGRPATVDGEKVDRYGRLVGKVIVAGRDVNLRQIEIGLAWHYKAYEREQPAGDRVAYAAAENAAKARRMGLWGMPHPVPPWEFRAARRPHGRSPP